MVRFYKKKTDEQYGGHSSGIELVSIGLTSIC